MLIIEYTIHYNYLNMNINLTYLCICIFLITEILDQIRSILLAIDPRILIFAFLMTGFVLILVPVGSNVSSI